MDKLNIMVLPGEIAKALTFNRMSAKIDEIVEFINSQIGGLISKAEDAASSAASAQESASSANQKLEELKVALQELPDGQAVTVQVANNTSKISDLEQRTTQLENNPSVELAPVSDAKDYPEFEI